MNYADPSGHAPWLILAVLALFTPVGGVALQTAVSTVGYVVDAVWAVGDLIFNNGAGAWSDMCNIKWNPFNSDATATVNSNIISFYKGVPVLKWNIERSGSFYGIVLRNGADATELNHERGHNWQAMMMGIANYGFAIGIPSAAGFGSYNEQTGDNYYRAPWEITADLLGGVSRSVHSKEDISLGNWYLASSVVYFPNCYLFLPFIE